MQDVNGEYSSGTARTPYCRFEYSAEKEDTDILGTNGHEDYDDGLLDESDSQVATGTRLLYHDRGF